jgi:hypothetical protein
MKVSFRDLFDGIDIGEPRHSERCKSLSGTEVEIMGYLSRAHPESERAMLVHQPGICPDCTPAPVPFLYLPGFEVAASAATAVRLRGRLAYGLERDDEGNATYLRLEQARISTGLS